MRLHWKMAIGRTVAIVLLTASVVPMPSSFASLNDTSTHQASPQRGNIALQEPGVEFEVLASEIIQEVPANLNWGPGIGGLILDRVVLQPGEIAATSRESTQGSDVQLLLVERGSIVLLEGRSSLTLHEEEQHLVSGPTEYQLENVGHECASALRLSVTEPTGMGGAFSSGVSGPLLPQDDCGESTNLFGWLTGPVIPAPAQIFMARVTINSGLYDWSRVHAGPTALLIESGIVSTNGNGSEMFLADGGVILTPAGQASHLTGRGESHSLVVGIVGVPGSSGPTGKSYLSNTALALGWDSNWWVSESEFDRDEEDFLELSSIYGNLTLESIGIPGYGSTVPQYSNVEECIDEAQRLLVENPSIDNLTILPETYSIVMAPNRPSRTTSSQRDRESQLPSTMTFNYLLTTEDGRYNRAPYFHHTECISTTAGVSQLNVTGPVDDADSLLKATESIYWNLP